MSFKIIGTGSYVPEKIVTNDDLSKMVETSDEWIIQRVGVKERHVAVTETAADFAYHAAMRALENSGTRPEEIDLIIAASITSDDICPTVAGSVQGKIGAKCAAFDINSACSGFIFALETAAGFFARGGVKKALVIGAERVSKIMDWTDRGTCVIFGDGAGAAVLEQGDNYIASQLLTEGGDDVIHIPADHGASPFFKAELKAPFINMNGQETFKFAVNTMTNVIKSVVEKAGLTLDDISYIVPHQANIRIIQYASKKLKLPIEKFFTNIEKYGNTSSASVPIALDELNRSGNLKRGDIIVMSAFGGGLSSGTCLIRW